GPARVRRLQPVVDPADQIPFGNVANEQVEGIGGLVEVAVAQVMGRDWTTADMLGLGAGSAELGISAAMEMPVALELGAGDALGKFLVDVLPLDITVLLHIVVGDLIRDALVAESCDQPIEDRRGIALSHCCSDTISMKVGANLVDQTSRTGQTANSVDHADRMVDCGCPVVNFGMILVLDPIWPSGDHGGQIIATS